MGIRLVCASEYMSFGHCMSTYPQNIPSAFWLKFKIILAERASSPTLCYHCNGKVINNSPLKVETLNHLVITD